MPRWLSPNSEILILALIGFVITVIEAMYLNLNENIREAWKMTFPDEILSGTLENMVKSVVAGIIIVRGATVHVYLASYLLLIFPVLKERRRMLLLIWLTVSGFRSILVNGVATIVGISVCSCLPEPHPACFEFLSTKGVELACSVYMWVIVNDFLYYLKRKHRTVEDIPEKSTIMERVMHISNEGLNLKNNITQLNSDDSNIDSDGSVGSSPVESSVTLSEASAGSCDSLIAKAAVNWFFRLTLGMKQPKYSRFHGRRADRDEELSLKFLQMSPEEVENLTQKIKQFLASTYMNGDKLKVISDEQAKNTKEEKMAAQSDVGKQKKVGGENSKVSEGKKSSVFRDSMIIPHKFHSIEVITSDANVCYNSRNRASQTDPLPRRILKKIEIQEKEIQKTKL